MRVREERPDNVTNNDHYRVSFRNFTRKYIESYKRAAARSHNIELYTALKVVPCIEKEDEVEAEKTTIRQCCI